MIRERQPVYFGDDNKRGVVLRIIGTKLIIAHLPDMRSTAMVVTVEAYDARPYEALTTCFGCGKKEAPPSAEEERAAVANGKKMGGLKNSTPDWRRIAFCDECQPQLLALAKERGGFNL